VFQNIFPLPFLQWDKKLVMAVIISVLKQADFVSVSPLHSSILFVGKAGVIVNVAPS